MTVLPDRGRLGVLPLPTLLLLLHRHGFSGRLCLVHEPDRRVFELSAGRPVRVHPGPREPGPCATLVAAGRLDAAGAARAETLAASKSISEEKAILALHLLGPRDLLAALRERARSLALDAFAWADASFELQPDAVTGPSSSPVHLLDDAVALVHQGLLRWSPERIVATMGTPAFRYVHEGASLAAFCAEHPNLPGVEALRARLDGRSRLADLARDCGHPAAFAAAFLLDALGTLASSEEPLAPHDGTRPPTDAAEPLIEIVVEGRGASKEMRVAGADSAAAGMPANERGDALRRAIREKRERLEGMDHYAVLGVPRQADLATVRRAYVASAKSFHPDVLLRLGLDDVRDEANAVFAAVSEAHAVLSDPTARRLYDESLGDGGTQEVQRAATAESLFRKGEVLLRMGSFDEALRFLRPAVELCGEDAVYLEACGWALFKKQASEPDAARAALERAVGIDPGNPVARTRLATVLRALGKEREANDHLVRARALGGEGRGSSPR